MAKAKKSAKVRLSDEELAAMKEHVAELKAAARRGSADDEESVLAKIAEMPEADRAMGEKLHALIKAAAPELTSRLWYGMPAYAKNGKTVCFYQNAGKFKARYGTLGFTDNARLDDGTMWPASYALTRLTADDEKRISALVRKAVA